MAMKIPKIEEQKARWFYSKLAEIIKSESDDFSSLIIKVGSLLEGLFKQVTKDTLPFNSKLYERIKKTEKELPRELLDKAHFTRILTNKIRHEDNFQPGEADYKRALETVAILVSYFSGIEIPSELGITGSGNKRSKNLLHSKNKKSVENVQFDSSLVIDEDDLINNPTPRLPICLALDTSGSMSVDNKIGKLNEGVKLFFDSILNDELARYSVEISVVSFGGTVKHLLEFGSIESQVEKIKQFKLVASGTTPMGEAVEFSLALLDKRKEKYKNVGVEYYQPWIVIMTDGQPTDKIDNACRLTTKLESERKLVVFPIAIGKGANMVILSKFSKIRKPMRLKGLNFAEFFEWLSQSVKITSQSIPGDKIKLPPISGWAEI